MRHLRLDAETMTPKEAYEELGLGSDATLDDLKAAYRRRAKETHPDKNRDDPGAAQRFHRVQLAYDRLTQFFAETLGSTARARSKARDDRGTRGNDFQDGRHEHSGPDEDQSQHENHTDPLKFVRGFMANCGIVVLADGFLENTNHIKRPSTPQEFHQFLLQPEVTLQSLVDDMMLQHMTKEQIGGRAILTTAVRRVVSEDAKIRTSVIFHPLINTLGTAEHGVMFEELTELISIVFKGPAPLIARALLHFVWQVHRRTFGYPVAHHLMPVIWSAEQGTGKSEFVKYFCAPLKELFSPPITLEDFIDTRFSSALDYAVLNVDEIPVLTLSQVDAVKLILSSEELLRRQPISSRKLRIRQKSSAIGTANGPPERQLYDPSGYRRFLSIEKVDARSRLELFEAVERFDFERMWRMENATNPPPILPVLNELRAYQANHAPQSPLLKWLVELDISSASMRKIHFSDGFRADELRLLFNDCHRLYWSRGRFSSEMEQFFEHPRTPFGGKRVIHGITYYRLKLGQSRDTR